MNVREAALVGYLFKEAGVAAQDKERGSNPLVVGSALAAGGGAGVGGTVGVPKLLAWLKRRSAGGAEEVAGDNFLIPMALASYEVTDRARSPGPKISSSVLRRIVKKNSPSGRQEQRFISFLKAGGSAKSGKLPAVVSGGGEYVQRFHPERSMSIKGANRKAIAEMKVLLGKGLPEIHLRPPSGGKLLMRRLVDVIEHL